MEIHVISKGTTKISPREHQEAAVIREAISAGDHARIAYVIDDQTDIERSGIRRDDYVTVTGDDGTVLWQGWVTGDRDAPAPAEALALAGKTPGQAFREVLHARWEARGLRTDHRPYDQLPAADQNDLEAAAEAARLAPGPDWHEVTGTPEDGASAISVKPGGTIIMAFGAYIASHRAQYVCDQVAASAPDMTVVGVRDVRDMRAWYPDDIPGELAEAASDRDKHRGRIEELLAAMPAGQRPDWAAEYGTAAP